MTDQPTPPLPPQQPVPPTYGAAPAAGPAGTPGAPVSAPPGTDYPGKTLGVVALVAGIVSYFILPIVAGIAAIIMGAIARKQSKQAGYKNTMALVGLILGIVNIVVYAIVTIIIIVAVIAAVSASGIRNPIEVCNEYGSGVWEIDGVTYTCS
jgi:hypothetical protein